MTISLRWTHAAILMPLLLAACASTPRNARDIPPPAPASFFTVPAHSGETVPELASRYQVSEIDVQALNDLQGRKAFADGAKVRIPAYGRMREAATVANNEPAQLSAPPRSAPRTTIVTRELDEPRSAGDVPTPRPKPVQPEQTAQADQSSWFGSWFSTAPDPIAPPAKSFAWPVKGQVLSAFGPAENGERNDGINILAARGAPVHAADAGTVTYVGNELKSYGNLVLIRHDNGYVTAYAHSDRVTVARGDRVMRGQIIAYAGETGDVSRPQVHFEIRVGTRPVDPRPYLVASN